MTTITKINIHTFTNEDIIFFKQQQLNMMERAKVSNELYEYHHKNYMNNPTNENERKALKAYEFYSYDMNNLEYYKKRELEERLRVASELLEEMRNK